jgi:hypothetical protein
MLVEYSIPDRLKASNMTTRDGDKGRVSRSRRLLIAILGFLFGFLLPYDNLEAPREPGGLLICAVAGLMVSLALGKFCRANARFFQTSSQDRRAFDDYMAPIDIGVMVVGDVAWFLASAANELVDAAAPLSILVLMLLYLLYRIRRSRPRLERENL